MDTRPSPTLTPPPDGTAPRRVWGRPLGADRLVLAGVVLWVVAQVLPACTTPGIDLGFAREATLTIDGYEATFLGWTLVLLHLPVDPVAALAILVAWSANIWLVVGLVSLARHQDGAPLVWAIMAAGCAAVGMWVLLAGGFPEIGFVVIEVGVGSWVWFASILVVLAGLVPLPSRLRSAG